MSLLIGAVSGTGGGSGPPPPPTGIVVQITFPGGSPVGGTLSYDIANGTNEGDYSAPGGSFTQQCIRVRNASLPNFFIDIRPDVSGGRIEVVVWNGEQLGTVASKTFRNLPAYNAQVFLNGVLQSDWRGQSTTSIPYHYWGNRWRWQSSLRPIIRTATQVFSQGWLPNMSLSAARLSGYSGVIVPTAPSVPAPGTGDGQNGNGTGMTLGPSGYLYLPFMTPDESTERLWGVLCPGDTGGYRPEQGLITKWQADWLLTGSASSLNTMFQQAEFFSCQENAVFLPDQVAGGPINQKSDLAHYKVSTYNYSSYYLAVTGGTASLTAGGFNGSISGTTLTVSSSPSVGPIQNGMIVKGYSSPYAGITPGTYIVNQLTGTPGDIGTYQVSKSQSVASELMSCPATHGEFISKGDEHIGQFWYLPFILTEDPFYIEGAQYHETYALQMSIYYKENLIGNLAGDATGVSGINGALTLAPANPGVTEERALGWSVKNIASCYKMSPASAPNWMLSRAVWAGYSSDLSRFIDWQRAQFPTDQYYSVFNSICLEAGDTPQTFYKSYVAYSFGFADLVGLTVPGAPGQSAPSSWHSQLTYMFNFLAQTSDPALTSGYNTQTPLIHDLGGAGFMSNQGGASSSCTPGSSGVPPSGTNCVSTYAGLSTYVVSYLQTGTPYPSNPSPGYIGNGSQLGNAGPLFAAAAVAKSRGIAQATGVMNQISAMIDYSYPQVLYGVTFNQQDGFNGS